eukprot:365980-Chlamydomonas_euryale.AAC.3
MACTHQDMAQCKVLACMKDFQNKFVARLSNKQVSEQYPRTGAASAEKGENKKANQIDTAQIPKGRRLHAPQTSTPHVKLPGRFRMPCNMQCSNFLLIGKACARNLDPSTAIPPFCHINAATTRLLFLVCSSLTRAGDGPRPLLLPMPSTPLSVTFRFPAPCLLHAAPISPCSALAGYAPTRAVCNPPTISPCATPRPAKAHSPARCALTSASARSQSSPWSDTLRHGTASLTARALADVTLPPRPPSGPAPAGAALRSPRQCTVLDMSVGANHDPASARRPL